MKVTIVSDGVVLHLENKTLPRLSIQEADAYLMNTIQHLSPDVNIDVKVDIEFNNGTKLTEIITVSNKDELLENIIRYHIIGLIRYKAGLFVPSKEYADKYKKELAEFDTVYYRNIYDNCSFFYSERKDYKRNRQNGICMKLQIKYTKLIRKEEETIRQHQKKLNLYTGVVDGLQLAPNYEDHILKYTTEFASLSEGTERYCYIKGILQGMEIIKNCCSDVKQ